MVATFQIITIFDNHVRRPCNANMGSQQNVLKNYFCVHVVIVARNRWGLTVEEHISSSHFFHQDYFEKNDFSIIFVLSM